MNWRHNVMPLCHHPARPLEKPLPANGSGFSSADLFKDYWINLTFVEFVLVR